MSACILCAIEPHFSEQDADILRRAAQVAELDGARLDVVTVVPDFGLPSVSAFFPPDHQKKALAETSRLLHEFTARTLGKEVSSKIRHEVSVGRVWREVVRVAKLAGSDMIVLGAHRRGIEDYVLGTTAEHVVRYATASVLVIR